MSRVLDFALSMVYLGMAVAVVFFRWQPPADVVAFVALHGAGAAFWVKAVTKS